MLASESVADTAVLWVPRFDFVRLCPPPSLSGTGLAEWSMLIRVEEVCWATQAMIRPWMQHGKSAC